MSNAIRSRGEKHGFPTGGTEEYGGLGLALVARPVLKAIPCAFFALGVVACGSSPEAVIEITDAPDVLTSDTNDKLFFLTVVESQRAFLPDRVLIAVDSQSGLAVPVKRFYEDPNGDGLFGQGEAVQCREAVINAFDAAAVGREFDVSVLYTEDGGDENEIARGVWLPAN